MTEKRFPGGGTPEVLILCDLACQTSDAIFRECATVKDKE
jgi:hypothetical protein